MVIYLQLYVFKFGGINSLGIRKPEWIFCFNLWLHFWKSNT
ncbi:hypothetical protein LEP1GSC013_3420 [Leptospira interrogans serovar Valbuzzi str. Duyster]|nr:hypothetical protein LEP1GSC013_3420 [Leptospira interrogans serovar Valbuzzi str. Duyster]ENO70187.1 hypothetical protein LEP1GSC012_4102 [Leptospira interrogans serovar Valbuzzi str. Valbuzzi]